MGLGGGYWIQDSEQWTECSKPRDAVQCERRRTEDSDNKKGGQKPAFFERMSI